MSIGLRLMSGFVYAVLVGAVMSDHVRGQTNYEFLFMAAPLGVEKGTGSPINPLAVF